MNQENNSNFLTSLKIISQLFRFHVFLVTHPSRSHPAKHVKINHVYFWVLPIKYLICLWFSLFMITQKQQNSFFADKAMSCSFYAKRNHMGLKRNLNCNYVCQLQNELNSIVSVNLGHRKQKCSNTIAVENKCIYVNVVCMGKNNYTHQKDVYNYTHHQDV